MQLDSQVRAPAQQAAGVAAFSHPWILGLIATDDSPKAEPGSRPDSFSAECECPDDCLRDHENE